MGTRQAYVDSMKAAFVKAGTDAIMGYLIAEVPFLESPVIKQVVEHFVQKIVQLLVDKGETAAFFAYIDMRGAQQGEDFSVAADKYRVALAKGDANEIKKAEKELEDSFRALVKFTN